jgi:hypothetical protein
MALEVHEISIGMNLLSGAPQGTNTSDGSGSSQEPAHNDALVRECVRRVLQALKEGRER